MLKMEKITGSISSKSANDLLREVARQTKVAMGCAEGAGGEASCASRLPVRTQSKGWKAPAIPQPGIPGGRGCASTVQRQVLPPLG